MIGNEEEEYKDRNCNWSERLICCLLDLDLNVIKREVVLVIYVLFFIFNRMFTDVILFFRIVSIYIIFLIVL